MATISKTRDEIMSDLLYRMEKLSPVTESEPGSIARTFLEVLSEGFYNFYNQLEVNSAMAFVSTSRGQYLDMIGALLDCKRLPEEEDADYRARITQQVYVVAGANLTSIRLKVLSIPEVKDVMFREYSHGAGSFSVYVITDEPQAPQSLLNQVQEVVDQAKAYGVYGEVKTPVLIPVELMVRLIFSDDASANERISIRQNVGNNVRSYINSIAIGDTLVMNEVIQRIMETSDKIKDVDIYSLKVNRVSRFVGNASSKWEERFILDTLDIT